jgi:23S rRNA (guanine2445-N2)-methyltransferase / 23S rRNA (guanine2069-N7)-methyltransferase
MSTAAQHPIRHSFFATTAKALEPLLARELESLGIFGVKPGRAGVYFEGTLETAYRACLWSRIANRILLPIKKFAAPDEAKLYAGVKSIRWSEHLRPEGTLAVEFAASRQANSQVTHTHYGALKVKDAIVDQFRSTKGTRPSVDVERPEVRVHVYLHQGEATISIDLSGDSLHKRGYRTEGAEAPMKENLAAAILMEARWAEASQAGEAFLDPMCGSGTLPLEAARIALDIAPGLDRNYFGFLKWLNHDAAAWKRLLEEAQDREEAGAERQLGPIHGYDQDARAVRSAIENLENAGLRGRVHFEKRTLENTQSIAPKGVLVVNPPYGERLGEVEELKPLYKQIGDTFKQKFPGWTGYVFTGSPDLAKVIGLQASRRIPMFNGPIECRLLEFPLHAGKRLG